MFLNGRGLARAFTVLLALAALGCSEGDPAPPGSDAPAPDGGSGEETPDEREPPPSADGGGAGDASAEPITMALTVPATAQLGVPFEVSWPDVAGAARCVGSGALVGKPVAELDEFTTADEPGGPRAVLVAPGSIPGALELTLTCWAGAEEGPIAVLSGTVQVLGGGPKDCPQTITTPYNGTRTWHQKAPEVVYGAVPQGTRRNVDLRRFDQIWGFNDHTAAAARPFPGVGGSTPYIRAFPRSGYIGAHFRTPKSVPAGYAGGSFHNPSYSNNPWLVMAISRACGDFSEHLDTPGCLAVGTEGQGVPSSDAKLASWKFTKNAPSSFCNIAPDTDYYVNITYFDPAQDVFGCAADKPACGLNTVSYNAGPL